MYFFQRSKINSYLLLFILLLASFSCKSRYEKLDLSMYQYRDTKNLVRFVYDASLKLEKEGLKSLDYFRRNRDQYRKKDYYLYIYDLDGNNLFHAGMPELENTNLKDITDKNGKKVTQLVLDALKNENNPHSWVHYSWWEPGKFYPVPKSSCHFKVKTPEGRELFVGAGMDYPHEEREFIRIIVDDAASLLEEKGSEAITDISDPRSEFNYRDVRIFIIRPDGEIIISPMMDSTVCKTSIMECTDEVGHKPFASIVKKLKDQDSAWEIFMAKNRYRRDLVKKTIHMRKASLAGKDVLVGAITDLPEPP